MESGGKRRVRFKGWPVIGEHENPAGIASFLEVPPPVSLVAWRRRVNPEVIADGEKVAEVGGNVIVEDDLFFGVVIIGVPLSLGLVHSTSKQDVLEVGCLTNVGSADDPEMSLFPMVRIGPPRETYWPSESLELSPFGPGDEGSPIAESVGEVVGLNSFKSNIYNWLCLLPHVTDPTHRIVPPFDVRMIALSVGDNIKVVSPNEVPLRSSSDEGMKMFAAVFVVFLHHVDDCGMLLLLEPLLGSFRFKLTPRVGERGPHHAPSLTSWFSSFSIFNLSCKVGLLLHDIGSV